MFRHILFDLDDTLYSVRHDLSKFFSQRLREFVSNYLNLPMEESDILRADGYSRGKL